MKVRTYLTLTAVAALVPVVLLATAALNMLHDAEREAALRSVHETARATALIVDSELAAAEARLRALGTSAQLEAGDLSAFYRQAKAVTAGDDSWIVLFDAEGQQLLNTRAEQGAPLPRRRRPERGLETLRTGRPFISNLIEGPVAQRPVISIEVPAPLSGDSRYVIGQAFVAEYFDRAFAQPGLQAAWVIGIIDRDGFTIARSRAARQFLGRPTAPELIKAARETGEGVLRARSLDGVEVYAVYTRSKMSGWIVSVGVPVDEIERTARRAAMVAGTGLLAAIVAALAVALLLGRRLADAIAAAARSAAALGRGEAALAAQSGVNEVDKLHAALAEAGELLRSERESRATAESARAELFASEQEARRMAEQQNRMKDEFLAMLGHELRNPLGAIANAVSIIDTAGLSAESSRRAAAVISRQSRHLGRIVDDLLDVSRVMSGKVYLDRQRIDLAEAVRLAAGALSETRRTGPHLLQVDTQPAWVDADPTRLEQIISNLVVNAAKYTPGTGRIDIQVRAAGGNAVLTVRDTGIGIPGHLLPHVFEVFVQGPAQLDRTQGGLGIGLALVQRLVTLHGGTVEARSEGAGKGSTFTVCLPLAAEPAGDDSAARTSRPVRDGSRVLLVEDSEDNRQTLAAVLSIYGHTVIEAADGHAGLRLALAETFDVAVIDIGLPGMDGYELARRLRAAPATAAMRLIAVTGYGQEEDRRRALEAGFDAHLVKPAEPARLLDAIARVDRHTGS